MSKDAKTLMDIMVQIQTRDALPIPMKKLVPEFTNWANKLLVNKNENANVVRRYISRPCMCRLHISPFIVSCQILQMYKGNPLLILTAMSGFTLKYIVQPLSNFCYYII